MNESFKLSYSYDIGSSFSGPDFLVVFSIILISRYAFMYVQWRLKLRKLKSNNVVVAQFSAPPDIPPAFFGVIVDNRMSFQDFIATILSLANKGYLSLEYDPLNKDYLVTRKGEMPPTLHEHESYTLSLFGHEPVRASSLKSQHDLFMKFNFLLSKDLQNSDFYHFDSNINSLEQNEFYATTIKRAAISALVNPWNWPSFVISLVYFPYAIVWGAISLVFYNRVGVYSKRTKKWEAHWAHLAGYYNYLATVEAEKRSSDLDNHKSGHKVSVHDPFLVSAQLQKRWQSVFMDGKEIGAGGKEYKTI